MKLASSRHLDALCGEYLVGTLRGPARRRFERALRDEPRVALRLRHWESFVALAPSQALAVEPSPRVWRRLSRGLGLSRYRPAWYRRFEVWRAVAAGTLAALVVAIAVPVLDIGEPQPPRVAPIAELAAEGATVLTAHSTPDRALLQLVPGRPMHAGPAQSYELWLIPAEGGAPLSLAVLGDLTARVPVAPDHARRLVPGAKLAITVEPAGGSPSGKPTGSIIMAGQIGL